MATTLISDCKRAESRRSAQMKSIQSVAFEPLSDYASQMALLEERLRALEQVLRESGRRPQPSLDELTEAQLAAICGG